jgi:hypothetical protein
MKFTAEQIAIVLEGKVVGNPSASVSSFSKIEEGIEGTLTFLANPKYESYIYSTKATITIVNETFVPENEVKTTMILVEDAYMSFTKLLTFYDQARKDSKIGIEQPSTINENVTPIVTPKISQPSPKHWKFDTGELKYIHTNKWALNLTKQMKEDCRRHTIHGVIVKDLAKNHPLYGEQGLYTTKKFEKFDVIGEYLMFSISNLFSN